MYATVMENGPHSFRPGALPRLESSIGHLEDYLLLGKTKRSAKEKLVEAILRDVGEEAINRKAYLVAVGYSENADGFVVPEPLAVDSHEARLRGLVIKRLQDTDRAFLHYDVYHTDDSQIVDQYLVPPLLVLESEVDSEKKHPLFEIIEHTRFLAERMIVQTDFYNLPAEEQIKLLQAHVADEFMGYAAADYHEEVLLQVCCERYYCLPIAVGIVEDWSKYERGAGMLSGYMANATYLECVANSDAPLRSQQDFIDDSGLPCIVLNTGHPEMLTLVPLSSASTFSSDIDEYV